MFYTVEEVASLLKLSKSKVYELTDQGKLGYNRFDGAKRISQKHIDDYIAQTECEPREPKRGRRSRGALL